EKDDREIEIHTQTTATTGSKRTSLTAPKPLRPPTPTDDDQKQIHEPMPPRQTRTELRTRPIIPPHIDRTQNPTTIQRLNTIYPPPPPPNQRERLRDQLQFLNSFHHWSLKRIQKLGLVSCSPGWWCCAWVVLLIVPPFDLR